jgi:hypothetical protein
MTINGIVLLTGNRPNRHYRMVLCMACLIRSDSHLAELRVFIKSISLSTKFSLSARRTFPHPIKKRSMVLFSGKEGAGLCRKFDKTHIRNGRSDSEQSHEGWGRQFLLNCFEVRIPFPYHRDSLEGQVNERPSFPAFQEFVPLTCVYVWYQRHFSGAFHFSFSLCARSHGPRLSFKRLLRSCGRHGS